MTTNNCKHTEWILEIIDHLRRRKARPDVERICHVVRRRYGMSAAETEAKLEKLVESEIVIKVDYKGSTSYRNAAKWRKSMLGCAVLNSNSISVKILEAILELSKPVVSENNTENPANTDSEHTCENKEVKCTDAATTIGTSIENINPWLQKNCESFDQLKSPLTVVLKREIDAGRITRLGNTNYVITLDQMKDIGNGGIRPLRINKKLENKPVGLANPTVKQKTNNDQIKTPSPQEVPTTDANQGPSQPQSVPQQNFQNAPAQPARRGRPPKNKPLTATIPTSGQSGASTTATTVASSKLKRILTANLDGMGAGPSVSGSPESKVAKKSWASHSSSHQQGELLCDFCQMSTLCRQHGEPESLLFCKDCTARAHPSCMKYSAVLASRAYKTPWQCMDCKTCCVCQDPGDPDFMLFCDGCDKGYHTNCHQPAVTKKPSGLWECSDCKLETMSSQRTDLISQYGSMHSFSTGSAPPTPAESPVSMMNGEHSIPTSPIYSPNGVFPDASDWSVNDVVKYMSSAGFIEEAKVFKEQEIDGVALLLLKRADVLKGLDIKLGPALKINRHVQGLQSAKDIYVL